MVGDSRFPALSITEEAMRQAVEEAGGLEMCEWEEMARITDAESKSTGHTGVYCMRAKKV